uniref:Uncharacterized protein n=1 Tax=Arundo donax TaxID=35708 RepID=A0A0A9BXH1_ARUDO
MHNLAFENFLDVKQQRGCNGAQLKTYRLAKSLVRNA